MTELATITDEQQAVQVYEPSPTEVIEVATARANALKGVVDSQELFTMIQGKKYLVAEAWQTVAALNMCHFETEWTRPIRDPFDEEAITGFLAKVNLIDQNGNVKGSGIMPCGYDDFPCRGKTGTPRDRAAMSAAQTWAGSKAARATFAWVVTLAGYAPTPAEEMDPGPQNAPSQPRKPAASRSLPRTWSDEDWGVFIEGIKDDGKTAEDLTHIVPNGDVSRTALQQFANDQKFANSAAFVNWCLNQWAKREEEEVADAE